MIIESLTPIQATASLLQAVTFSVCIKQPLWLRLATVGSCAHVLLAKKSGNMKHVYIAEGIDFVVSSIRFTNAKKTKQLKKEFGLGIGLGVLSATAVALEEHYRSEMLKKAEEILPA